MPKSLQIPDKYSNSRYYTKPDTPKNEEIKHPSLGDSASIESDDSQKYEIDTKVLLEETYNNWLGRSRNDEGKWVDDPTKKQMMTKELADKLIGSIRLKVNTHSLVSIYDKELINKIAYETALVWNEDLMFTITKYKISTGDFRLLMRVDVPFLIKQLLLTALNGNMVNLRSQGRAIHIHKNESDGGNF